MPPDLALINVFKFELMIIDFAGLLTYINVDIWEVVKVRSVIDRGHIDCDGRGPVSQVTPVHIFHPAQLFHLLQAGHSPLLGRQ